MFSICESTKFFLILLFNFLFMQKFGTCEFTVNDLVLYTSRFGDTSDDVYEVIEVLPNKDGTYEDRPFIENYLIKDIKTKKEYLVYHSELTLKQ